jgi:hypothetical protein
MQTNKQASKRAKCGILTVQGKKKQEGETTPLFYFGARFFLLSSFFFRSPFLSVSSFFLAFSFLLTPPNFIMGRVCQQGVLLVVVVVRGRRRN